MSKPELGAISHTGRDEALARIQTESTMATAKPSHSLTPTV